ncbi:MAG: glycogen synthase GlgA [Candidatus Hydrogenedentes bacterium]|nr:glycogen synthase GlgA [Candidatus Hydrogenedentota bacterium]
MKDPLRILYLTSELSPLVSTGGLAEVAAALPPALQEQGVDIRLAMPCYAQIPKEYRGTTSQLCRAQIEGKAVYGAFRTGRVPGTQIPLYLIEHEGYFGRDTIYGSGAYEYDDNAERYCFFCQAVLDGIKSTGWRPHVIHCNDWHTAPVPILLKTQLAADPFYQGMASLFTVHNLAYQGRYSANLFPRTGLDPALFTPEYLEYEGDMNLMKGALLFANAISTVSPRYAREIQTVEYGSGLHGVLGSRRDDLHGILNGVDYGLWNPATDPHIASPFDSNTMGGKKLCKTALQDMFRLPRSNAPLFGVISRLHWQKGMDLISDALDELAQLGLQLVVLGTGDPALEAKMNEAAARYPNQIAVYLGFDIPRAHAVQAGSDFLLMPSRYEPCGLTQLYSLAYGTLPVVRRTGGLADTVTPYRPLTGGVHGATGFSFTAFTWQALWRSIRDAVQVYENKELLAQLRHNAMVANYSWNQSSKKYIDLYHTILKQSHRYASF